MRNMLYFISLSLILIITIFLYIPTTPLYKAADNEAMTALREVMASLDAVDNDGNTPLHKAAWHGHTEAITDLLDAGANPNAMDRLLGSIPLHVAARNGKPEAITALLDAGADPQI